VPLLDTTRASSGSARAYVALLQALWSPSKIDDEVCVLRHEVGVAQHQDGSAYAHLRAA
jgi:beta-lactamase class A